MPWLTVTTFLPLVGLPVLILWPGLSDRAARWVALAVSVATFGVSLGILANFDSGRSGFQLVEQAQWISSPNVRYLLGVDGISLWMVLLTTFLLPVAVLASWRETRNVPAFMATLLFLETAMLGTFVSLDLLLFFLFFEGMLFPAYLIVGGWGGERRAYAAVKFFIFTMAGSAFLFAAILYLYFRSGAGGAGPTFDVRTLEHVALPMVTARWLFLAFLVAFAVKIPLVPLHTWLPDTYTEAPVAGLVLVAGVLPKIGAYGLLRFNLALFPEASRHFGPMVSGLALAGIVYGAVVAIVQTDLKRLVAYSSIAHLGFVVLGTFALTEQAVAGGVLEMVNHGLSTAALFLLVGMLAERTRTRDLGRMGGIAQVTPSLAVAFLFVALASVGLPGLNHFVGELLVIVGAFARNRAYAAIAAAGVVLSAIYLLWAYQRAMHGPVREEHVGRRDLTRLEVAVLAPILAAIVAIGVYPKPFLDRIEPTTKAVVQSATATSGGPALASAGGGP